MRVFLIGLRRSGTTVLFELFRQDARFVCFDEPFNHMIRDIPTRDEWGSKAEFIDLYNSAPKLFWKKYAYINGLDELRDQLTLQQSAWASYLLESSPNIFMDFTRMNFKIEDLHTLAPEALLIHIHRSPASFSVSHILPSVWKQNRYFKYLRKKQQFWEIYKKYDHWGLETVIGRSNLSYCGEIFKNHGFNVKAIYTANAATRLTAFWNLNFMVAQQDGRRLFGENYIQIPFEDFTKAPDPYVKEIYDRLGVSRPNFDFSAIRPASGNLFPGHPGWRRIQEILEINPEQVQFKHDVIM